ncbi:MAG TPA: DUF4389 domain-containing protein [Acidimicrobiales bacterium]|nr:DUF4389 domain-containing protein [Acidimicrobiales bacterium]HVC26449.1 DUF4389 domain-containing protein [Acidimicrobiales bacterium]
MTTSAAYPVRVDATLDPDLSRWLWLVKWLLAIPHYVVLAFLWPAFVLLSVVAFFAILLTGRYPAALFEFNVGVLRWSWRVAYYSYSALGTDRYPPFTLAEVADYPAHIEIAYPDHLSRGLVLVKWWLLALPQYVVVGVFVGGTGLAWEDRSHVAAWGPGGLIGLLVFVAAIVLAVTDRYPRQLFDFVLGLNRWVLRVAAYAALMTDRYPPFRLDMGEHEGGSTVTLPPQTPPDLRETASRGAPGRAPGWTAGRVVSLTLGSLLGLVSLATLVGGGAATWLDHTQRDPAGYLVSNSRVLSTTTHAITSDRIDLGSSDVIAPASVLGTVRIRATAGASTAVFVGIGPQASVDRYLAGVSREVVTSWSVGTTTYRQVSGGPPSMAPTSVPIWTTSATGVGTQTVTWEPGHGAWTVVVMNPDGSAGVSVTADAGATVPALGWISAGLFAVGGLMLVGAVLLVAIPVARASRRVT